MATRKDLLKAHKFTSQRLISALVDRNPDEMEPPLRRVGTATFVGIMLAVLVLAGFGVVGLIAGGGTKNWQQDRTVIIDTSSGVVFAYLEDKLYPTANITSAKLATGGGPVMSVKPATLRNFPQQNRIGIPDAPAQLPAPDDITPYPLRVCSTAPNAKDVRYTTLQVGVGPPPATPRNAVVRDSRGTHYLLTAGRAYPVPAEGDSIPPLLIDLGFTDAGTPSDEMINTIPRGPSLAPLTIPGDGGTAQKTVGAMRVGSLATVTGSRPSYYVMLADGLSEISQLEHRALELSGHDDVELTSGEVGASLSPTRIGQPDMPPGLPTAEDSVAGQASAALCVTWHGPDRPATIELDSVTPMVGGAGAGGGTADLVETAPLKGALLRAEDSAEAGQSFLVVDGRRYGIPDADSRNALGYAETASQPVSPALLRLLPDGLAKGTLSIEAARQPV